MDLHLAGRTFIVTGGTRGLGRASAEALLSEGANVVVSGRTPLTEDRAFGEAGTRCVSVVADNADVEAPQRLISVAQESFGGLDGCLISVGGPPRGAFGDITDEAWTDAFNSVFLGAVRMAREVAAVLPQGGSIAFVLSSSVKSPLEEMAVSNGLRPGLAMVAKTLSDELGPRGIRVNGLLPGRIATDRLLELDDGTAEAAAARAASEASIPLRRIGEPAEFGRAAAWLLSPAASYITGAMLPVDGGLLRTL